MASTKAGFNEDKVALLIGCFIFVLGLGKMIGLDPLGWVLKMGMWVDNPIDSWRSATKGMLPAGEPWWPAMCSSRPCSP